MLRKLTLIVITFWVGGLWMTGLSASILFNLIDDRHLAGQVAGQLFASVSTIGLISSAYLLTQGFLEHKRAFIKQPLTWVVVLMLLLVLVGQFGIQPHLAQIKVDALPLDVMSSGQAGRFALWHGVAGGVYLVECVLGLVLVLIRQG